ncbi:tryptophan synthase subunit alpha [Corallincola platygyrae]|uniref:Tryptophan synthase alpha chain n=1 Tax=Corallincola platygyrae TaxID=1193278 RepID=A0ABW4XK50_9GAMM
MSTRYQQMFAELEGKQQGAFVPFVTIGDPDRELSLSIIDTLVDAGADALELGIPFSDPIADGPTIQGATVRALNSGINPTVCFEMLSVVREKYPTVPIGLLVYANLVYANGVEQFYQRCAEAGVDSVLVADVPSHESTPFRTAADKFGVDAIFIAPPNADDATISKVAEYGRGYTYLLSRAGVTGAETKAEMPVDTLLEALNKHDAPPALLGFGISEPAQVKEAIDAGAAGAISGSAVVKIIEQYVDDSERLLAEMHRFISGMKAATTKG